MNHELKTLTPEGAEVLASILSFGTSEDSGGFRSIRCQTPGSSALFEMCELLAQKPPEELLQRFLAHHPGFLMGMFGTNNGGDLAFIAKPKIDAKYMCDFALLQVFQGGATISLIEIETSHEAIFTQRLTPARRLQSALGQIDEWREWIEPNKLTFARSIVDQSCKLPLYEPAMPNLKGHRFMPEDELRGLWGAFGGSENLNVNYAIVIGRWSALTADEKRRFISKFGGESHMKVMTFEQLARHANYRGDRHEF